MSMKWPGNLIRKTPVTPTGPFEDGTAPGVWSLADAAYWTKQGLWPTAGNERLLVENVFSTWVYTGNGSTQTITTGINLSSKGGMIWQKPRTTDSTVMDHKVFDTARGQNNVIYPNLISDQNNGRPLSWTSSGFTLGAGSQFYGLNESSVNYVAWTFREAPNFFDIVTYTGDGNGSGQTLAHALGSVPGCIIIKPTSTTGDWIVTTRKGASSYAYGLKLNATNAETGGWTGPSSATTFNTFIGNTSNETNTNGVTYVAYLFAHSTASDGIIQCGSYTGNGSSNGPTVTLGWEPQWLLIKSATTATDWWIVDNMRGFTFNAANAGLQANSANTESSLSAPGQVRPLPTGFQLNNTGSGFNNSGTTYVYIAIRRGPMKTPTLGTSVFNTVVRTGTGVAATVSTGNTPDWIILKSRSGSDGNNYSRLTGRNRQLYTNQTFQEVDQGTNYGVTGFLNSAFTLGLNANNENQTGASIANWVFSRAPSFFDEVCYTGTGSARTVNHNLGVVPEMIIVKSLTQAGTYWMVQHSALGPTKDIYLQLTNAASTRTAPWNDTAPTSTVFTVGTDSDTNGNGQNLVAYLFASCPNVSKVGSYTGTGALQTINCGFTTGARFVLIKRTDSTGDWYVWNSATGISSGNDPYLLLNNGAAEVTGTNYVDTDTTGFQVTAAAPAGINANGGSYIFLAVS